jgi:hypothetical protein
VDSSWRLAARVVTGTEGEGRVVTPDDGARLKPPAGGRTSRSLAPGAEVEVLTRFRGDWTRGFEVASIESGRYCIRRRSDRALLPATFAAQQVRPAR